MKKLALFFLSICMIFTLAACSKKKEVTDTPEEIEQKIMEAVGTGHYPNDKKLDEVKFYAFYQLDNKEIESYIAKENADPSENPDRVVVMKVKEGYEKKAVEKINEAYGKIVEDVRTKDTELPKTLNARIFEQDGYVAFFLTGKKYEGDSLEKEIQTAKRDYEKIDNQWEKIFGVVPSNLAIVPPAE